MSLSKPLSTLPLLLFLLLTTLTGCVPPGKDVNPDEPIRAPFGNRDETRSFDPDPSTNERPNIFNRPELIAIETKLILLGCTVTPTEGVTNCPVNPSFEEANELLVTLRALRSARMQDRELLKDEKLSYLVSRTSTLQIESIEASSAILDVRREIYRLRSESYLPANVAGDMDVDLSYANRLAVSKLVKALSQDDRFNKLLGDLDIGLLVMSDVTRLDQPDGKRQLKINFAAATDEVVAFLEEQLTIHPEFRSLRNTSDRLRRDLRLSHNLYMTQLSEDSKIKGLELLKELTLNPRFAELLYLKSLDYIVLSSQNRIENNLNFQFLRIDFNSTADHVMQTLEGAQAGR
ncbi:MAG: hypothetical protein EOP07_08455 [Proteobacteria bacterium]|nr:MAG: hypothetical protein EOP07_08455 [Pseudomonadota bacterium]